MKKVEFEIVSAVHGIAPRSEELLKLGVDYEKGRASRDSFEELIQTETEDWLQFQADVGIDWIEDGKLKWQDHLRPIVKATSGFAPGVDNAPLTRWFEDNRFYRHPTITGKLKFDPNQYESLVGEPIGSSVSLIDPRLFSILCKNEHSIPALDNVSDLYHQLIKYYQLKGINRILFKSLVAVPKELNKSEYYSSRIYSSSELNLIYLSQYGRDKDLPDNQLTRSSSGQINSGDEVTVNNTNHLTGNLTSDITGEKRAGRQFVLNAVDARNTNSNEFSWPAYVNFLNLQASFPKTGKYVPGYFNRQIITHYDDLELLPLKIAKEKVKRLGEIAYQAREEIEKL